MEVVKSDWIPNMSFESKGTGRIKLLIPEMGRAAGG